MTIDPKKAVERLQKQYKNQNEYIKNNFDRVSITLPKGTKERIKNTGESLNGYINRLVLADLERLEVNSAQEQEKPPHDDYITFQTVKTEEQQPNILRDEIPEEEKPGKNVCPF